MSVPTVLYVAPAAVCVLSWLGAGALVPARLLSGEPLLDVLTRLALGAWGVSTALFLLGRIGLYRPGVLIGMTATLAAVGAWTALRVPRSRVSRLHGASAVVGILVVVALVLDVVGATAPPSSADALGYHLALPKHFLQVGRVDDPFWNFAAFYPLGIEMLFGQGLALAGASAASAIHGFLAVFTALATYGFARTLGGGSRAAGVVGAAFLVLQGTYTWDATSAFVDMGLTFFAVLAAWHAVRYARAPSRPVALLVGILCGAAAATKYVGPLAGGCVAVVGIAVAVRARRSFDAALLVAAAVAAGCCWYVRDWIVTGNPVYPLVFGGKDFTPFFRGYLAGSAKYSYPGTHSGTPLRVLILPVDLLLHGDRFDRGQFVSTAVFVAAAIAVWRLRRDRVVRTVAAVTFVYIVVWWYALPQVRYLMPALAALAALAGAGIGDWLADRGARRVVVVALLAVAAVAWAAPSFALERQLLPATIGAQSRAANVEKLVGTYDAMQAIRRRVGSEALVGFVGYRWPFWYPGRAIWVGWPEFSPDVPATTLVERLHREGVTDVVAWKAPPELVKMRRCMRRIGSYGARYVTSRSRGTGYPIRLDLYHVEGCL